MICGSAFLYAASGWSKRRRSACGLTTLALASAVINYTGNVKMLINNSWMYRDRRRSNWSSDGGRSGRVIIFIFMRVTNESYTQDKIFIAAISSADKNSRL
jgi:hypothetical protein